MSASNKFQKTVALLILTLCSGCQEQIIHDLGEHDANRVYVVLARAGISAEKVSQAGTWSIAVSSNKVTDALTALDDSRVLVRSKAVRASGGGGLLQSREQRLLEIEESLSETLQDTLLRIPGVLEARVHLRLEASRTIDKAARDQGKSASVLIVATRETIPSEDKVKALVAGAAAMEPSAVTVVTTTRDSNPNLVAPSEGVAIEERRAEFKSSSSDIDSDPKPGIIGLVWELLKPFVGYKLLAFVVIALSMSFFVHRLLRVQLSSRTTLERLRKEPMGSADLPPISYFNGPDTLSEENPWNTH